AKNQLIRHLTPAQRAKRHCVPRHPRPPTPDQIGEVVSVRILKSNCAPCRIRSPVRKSDLATFRTRSRFSPAFEDSHGSSEQALAPRNISLQLTNFLA